MIAKLCHTFAICAYMESEFLEECILSLEQQSVNSNIIICTATPNDYISMLASQYNLPIYINTGTRGIAEDWNFAYEMANSRYVTLVHQDDIYDETYLETMLSFLEEYDDTIIAFSNYYEIRNGKQVFSNDYLNLKIKEMMLRPLKHPTVQTNRWVRRRILSMGNPICCPAVTYVKNNLPIAPFTSHFQCNLDWEAWEVLSKRKGRFLYINRILMGHRIHEMSTSSKIIGDNNGRSREDLEMLHKFWPLPIAKLINRFYAQSQAGNYVKKNKYEGIT